MLFTLDIYAYDIVLFLYFLDLCYFIFQATSEFGVPHFNYIVHTSSLKIIIFSCLFMILQYREWL